MSSLKVVLLGNETHERELHEHLTKLGVANTWIPHPAHLQGLRDAISDSTGFLMSGRRPFDFVMLGLAIASGKVVWAFGPLDFTHPRITNYESLDAWFLRMGIER